MSLRSEFASKLNELRAEQGLSVRELAARAGVHQSLISALQTENRVIGEYNARRIGKALGLEGTDLQDFVLLAINNCSERVLDQFKRYPAEVLNLTAGKLASLGVSAESIVRCAVAHGDSLGAGIALHLDDGRAATIQVEVAIR